MHSCPSCEQSFDSKRGVSMHHVQTHGESIAGVEVECHNCGETTRTERWHLENYEHTFCSYECHYDFKTNAAAVECAHCGDEKTVPQYRIDRSERFFCDMDCHFDWQAENYSGPDHHNWRGGKSMYDAVKKALGDASWTTIRERANERGSGECAMCGGDNGEQALHVHHIVPLLAGGSNHPDNLMLLCQPCHNTAESYTRGLFGPILTA